MFPVQNWEQFYFNPMIKPVLYTSTVSSIYKEQQNAVCASWYAVVQSQSLDASEFPNKTQKGFMDLKGD